MLQAAPPGVTHQVSVRVAHQLMEAIAAGEFELGSRLPSERRLAERFEVSRPSLREALSALQFTGLVEARHGFGNVVVATEASVGGATRGSSRSRVELLQARLILEPEAVRVAATDPDPDQLARARALLDGMWLATEVGAETDLNLHVAQVSICRNRFIREAAVGLLEQARTNHWLRARSDAWMDPSLIETWTMQHEATLRAIHDRQPDAAGRACRQHLLAVAGQVIDRPKTSESDRAQLAALLVNS